MPRFVVLYHDQIEAPHWDLMLERKKVLATWQVPVNPDTWADRPITCTQSFDHRKHYLDYQGQLSDNRGWVKQFATGHYSPQIITDTLWEVTLQSQHLNGLLSLSHTKEDQWQLTSTMQG
jgi:hypothetical protein